MSKKSEWKKGTILVSHTHKYGLHYGEEVIVICENKKKDGTVYKIKVINDQGRKLFAPKDFFKYKKLQVTSATLMNAYTNSQNGK